MSNPYAEFVRSCADPITQGRSFPLGTVPVPERKAPKGPVLMMFSPHPDDECVGGGLALRLAREADYRVVNVAVTLGRREERKAGRLSELTHACQWLGFDVELAATGGMSGVAAAERSTNAELWASNVQVVAQKLLHNRPRVVMCPHAGDWHRDHIGTHHLVMDALALMPADFDCFVVETEFWAPMSSPNTLVELSQETVTELITALSFHVEEVRRNPYHLRLPAWMQDNVRRAEYVSGPGTAPPDFMFGVLCRVRRWRKGQVENAWEAGRMVAGRENVALLFER